jgi:hypothetical protein
VAHRNGIYCGAPGSWNVHVRAVYLDERAEHRIRVRDVESAGVPVLDVVPQRDWDLACAVVDAVVRNDDVAGCGLGTWFGKQTAVIRGDSHVGQLMIVVERDVHAARCGTAVITDCHVRSGQHTKAILGNASTAAAGEGAAIVRDSHAIEYE